MPLNNFYFIDVALPLPLPAFTYRLNRDLHGNVASGMRVLVPFRNRNLVGFVINVRQAEHSNIKDIKDIISVVDSRSVIDKNLLKIAEWISDYYFSPPGLTLRYFVPPSKISKINKFHFISDLNAKLTPTSKKIVEIVKANPGIDLETLKEITKINNTSAYISKLKKQNIINIEVKKQFPVLYKKSNICSSNQIKFTTPFTLTDQQKKCLDLINKNINSFNVILIHGITGSGKTEIYLHAIAGSLASGKQAIVMVPEIALTPQTISRFSERFGDKNIAVLHSRLGAKKRLEEWWRIKNGHVNVVIGPRSAVFAPLSNPGIIVVDEEHESSYKQEETPRYNARDVAVMRAKFSNALVILGSATPSLESFYNVKIGKYKMFSLDKRPGSSLPEVEVLDMRTEKSFDDANSAFSNKLIDNIRASLHKKEQIIIFLNRRGFSSFVLCRKCGKSLKCKNCDVSLTYYQSNNRLRCHYCGFTSYVPDFCPACESEHLQHFGLGTEKVEDSIRTIFPKATVARLDMSTSTKKGELEKILKDFENHKVDILIGTQMIAKGHDFPNVTLVGIISADISLNLPDFRASEHTFQLLTQVAGRSGRGKKPGKVIIQTFEPEHYSIKNACHHDYLNFYNHEIKYRKGLLYPPLVHIVIILFKDKDINKTHLAAKHFYNNLTKFRSNKTDILGPVPAAIPKINNYYRFSILLKGINRISLRNMLNKTLTEYNKNKDFQSVKVIFDVDPIDMI